MNENAEEVLIDLLVKQATEGLTDAELLQLEKLESGRHDDSFDLTVSAVSLIDERADEPMPARLSSNIRASAEKYFDEKEVTIQPASVIPVVKTETPRPSFLNWLGWAVAAAACVAVVAYIYM